jgi:translation initiation factor 1 (eIF-1/SUI1)
VEGSVGQSTAVCGAVISRAALGGNLILPHLRPSHTQAATTPYPTFASSCAAGRTVKKHIVHLLPTFASSCAAGRTVKKHIVHLLPTFASSCAASRTVKKHIVYLLPRSASSCAAGRTVKKHIVHLLPRSASSCAAGRTVKKHIVHLLPRSASSCAAGRTVKKQHSTARLSVDMLGINDSSPFRKLPCGYGFRSANPMSSSCRDHLVYHSTPSASSCAAGRAVKKQASTTPTPPHRLRVAVWLAAQ